MSMNNQTNGNDFSATDIIGMVTGIMGCITGFGVILYVKLSGSLRDKQGTKVKLEHVKSDGTLTKMTMSFTNDEKVQISSKSPEHSTDGWFATMVNWISGRERDITETHTSVLESPVVPAKETVQSIMPEIRLAKVKTTKEVTAGMFSDALYNNNQGDKVIGENRSEMLRDICRLMVVMTGENISTETAHGLFPTPRSDSSMVTDVSMMETDVGDTDMAGATHINKELRAKIIRKHWKDDKGKEPDKDYGICLVQEDLATTELPQLKVSGVVAEEGL